MISKRHFSAPPTHGFFLAELQPPQGAQTKLFFLFSAEVPTLKILDVFWLRCLNLSAEVGQTAELGRGRQIMTQNCFSPGVGKKKPALLFFTAPSVPLFVSLLPSSETSKPTRGWVGGLWIRELGSGSVPTCGGNCTPPPTVLADLHPPP